MVNKELKKLEALCKYANDLVETAGIKDQKEKAELYSVDNHQYFKCLLYVTQVFPDFELVQVGEGVGSWRGVDFSIRSALYKRFVFYSNNLEYITLLDACEGDDYNSDFYYYKSLQDLDDCESLIKLKQTVRAMIKNPDKFFRSE